MDSAPDLIDLREGAVTWINDLQGYKKRSLSRSVPLTRQRLRATACAGEMLLHAWRAVSLCPVQSYPKLCKSDRTSESDRPRILLHESVATAV